MSFGRRSEFGARSVGASKFKWFLFVSLMLGLAMLLMNPAVGFAQSVLDCESAADAAAARAKVEEMIDNGNQAQRDQAQQIEVLKTSTANRMDWTDAQLSDYFQSIVTSPEFLDLEQTKQPLAQTLMTLMNADGQPNGKMEAKAICVNYEAIRDLFAEIEDIHEQEFDFIFQMLMSAE
jgi:hypothetical protein